MAGAALHIDEDAPADRRVPGSATARTSNSILFIVILVYPGTVYCIENTNIRTFFMRARRGCLGRQPRCVLVGPLPIAHARYDQAHPGQGEDGDDGKGPRFFPEKNLAKR